jgi:hypothetical protein
LHDIYACKKGYIAISDTAPTSCNWVLSGLAIQKGIATYFVSNVNSISSVNYCQKTDYLIIRWLDSNSFKAEAVLYNNGEIRLTYLGTPASTSNTVGISYGSGGYNNIPVSSGPLLSKDYKFTF